MLEFFIFMAMVLGGGRTGEAHDTGRVAGIHLKAIGPERCTTAACREDGF